ncbi:MAG TPA: Holliday junction resolvase RuvX [Anaerolineae bacterium]|nr:Holliday junction resolvase RuvX [Anaerolineae bacterium]
MKGCMRILAVDHGEKRIGLALSDPTATIASPLQVIKHTTRLMDAAQVANLASENAVELIIIGQSFDEEGEPNLAGRRAANFAEVLKEQTNISIELVDESFSTKDARATVIEMGVSRKKRKGHHDALAAVMILRSYIESNMHLGG